MQRGGFPFRTVVLALFVVGTVYLLYLYNTTLGRLRDAELSAERYRREEETKVAQLQVADEQIIELKDLQESHEASIEEMMRNKDELQEKCDNDKREFTNRLNSLNQQHKMLKSQYDEHEVEQMRLEQEARRLKEEFEQVETQRNQEYQQLKQEKELEVSNLKDQIANVQRQNEQLQTQISGLKAQVQNGQSQVQYDQGLLRSMESEIASLKQQLVNQNSQLLNQQQQVRQNDPINNLQQQQPQQGLNNAQQQLLQQQQLQQQQQQQQLMQGAGLGQQGGVANMNIGNAIDTNLGVQQGMGVPNAGVLQDGFKNFQDQQQEQQQQQQQQQQVDVDNEQHQMVPPNNNADLPDAAVNGNVRLQVGGHPMRQEEVKDEDHQVLPPDLNAVNVIDRKGGRSKGVEGMGVGDSMDQHEDPLDLKQMAAPVLGDGVGGRGQEGELKDDVMQQQPPVNRGVERNAAEEEEEEEEEEDDQYRDDKYDDDNDNNNNNVRINADPGKMDGDYH